MNKAIEPSQEPPLDNLCDHTEISARLTTEFGEGFNERNLRYMGSIYQCFPIWNAVRSELTWTHYRSPPFYKPFPIRDPLRHEMVGKIFSNFKSPTNFNCQTQ